VSRISWVAVLPMNHTLHQRNPQPRWPTKRPRSYDIAIKVLRTCLLSEPRSDTSGALRELHPAVQAYEARSSLRPPAACFQVAGPGIEPGGPARPTFGRCPEPVGHLPRLQYVSDHGESRTPNAARARRSDRRVSANSTTWSCCLSGPDQRCASVPGIEPAFPADHAAHGARASVLYR
jgi:hypothetical protein